LFGLAVSVTHITLHSLERKQNNTEFAVSAIIACISIFLALVTLFFPAKLILLHTKLMKGDISTNEHLKGRDVANFYQFESRRNFIGRMLKQVVQCRSRAGDGKVRRSLLTLELLNQSLWVEKKAKEQGLSYTMEKDSQDKIRHINCCKKKKSLR